jgi:hypothetical protein
MSSPSLARIQVEALLSGKVAVPFGQRTNVERSTLPTGIASIDAATGGIPCGAISEITGPRWCSTGRRSLLTQLLASTTQEFFCALVDATDAFDPRSAEAAGVNLARLLWVRCSESGIKALEQAFKSADILLQGSGGFGLVIVDLACVPEKLVRRVPLSTWFRFRGVVEKLDASLIFVTPQPVLGTCSSLTLHLYPAQIQWSLLKTDFLTHTRFPSAVDFRVQIAGRRSLKKTVQGVHGFSAQHRWA